MHLSSSSVLVEQSDDDSLVRIRAYHEEDPIDEKMNLDNILEVSIRKLVLIEKRLKINKYIVSTY